MDQNPYGHLIGTMERATAIAKAKEMLGTARAHKAEVGKQRRELRRSLQDLETFCKRHGIGFVLEENNVRPPGEDTAEIARDVQQDLKANPPHSLGGQSGQSSQSST